ncbi:hypothetical protein [Rathayibacter soli]|uniref:hypothetical protein n=1 Tax=Rathayibacter soli TaxID=3144168 RepID=UPI0027E5679F|nr:hypothetical protein [Glaciibacter superstes]
MTIDAPTTPSLHTRRSRLIRAFWVPIVLVIAALGVSGTITLLHTAQLSPVDEWVYVDYLYKLPTQGVVHRGENIGEQALQIMACDGVKVYGPMGPKCGSDYAAQLKKFPYEGKTSADLYTPIYFGITWVVGGAIHLVTGLDLVTSWRLTGPLWQAMGMVLLFFLMRMWKIRPLTILALGLAVIASPFSWWTYTYISTDAPSFILGVLALIAAIKFVRAQWSGWWVVLISAIAITFKGTNILAIGLVGLYLLIQWLWERKSTTWSGWSTTRPGLPERRWLALPGIAALSGVAAIVVELVWLAIRNAIAVGPPPEQGLVAPLDFNSLAAQIWNFLPNTITSNVVLVGTTQLAYRIPPWVVVPLSWICIAGVLGAFWGLHKGATRTPVVVAVVAIALMAGPLLAISVLVQGGSYFPLPPRYGAPILGGVILLAGMTIKYRWAVWVLLGYSVALTAAVLVTAPRFA